MAAGKGFTFGNGKVIPVTDPKTGELTTGTIKDHYWYGHKEGATEPYTLRSIMDRYVETDVNGQKVLYSRDHLMRLRKEATKIKANSSNQGSSRRTTARTKLTRAGSQNQSSSSGTWSGSI